MHPALMLTKIYIKFFRLLMKLNSRGDGCESFIYRMMMLMRLVDGTNLWGV